MQQLKIFISSPGDVGREREITARVIERLQAEFAGSIKLEPYFWEHEPMRAHKDFQSQIAPPSKFDVFICILWSRLGTRLHPGVHHRPDGTSYASGTEYEFEDAMRSLRATNAPEMLIYRRISKPVPPLEPEEKVSEFFQQYTSLKSFWEQWTKDSAVGALKAALKPYEDLADFETRLGKHLHRVIQEHLPEGASGADGAATWTSGSPFRGLAAFDFEHYPVFRGRTQAVDEVLGALREQAIAGQAFVLVFGGSGVGKSSLARAGVLPMLVQPGVIEGIGLWRRVILSPADRRTGDLFDALAEALVRPEGLPELITEGTQPGEIARMLREAPQGVGLLIKSGLALAARDVMQRENLTAPPTSRLAVLVDQLEELFTLSAITEDERTHFIRALAMLARSGVVWVLSTLRSDFYPRCETYPELMELKEGKGGYHLKPPTQSEIGQMIRLPAAAAGLKFEENHQTGDRLDDLLRDEAMANPGALPLMAFALEELFNRRDKERRLLTLAAYDEMGRLQGSLGRRAEEVYAGLSEQGRASMDVVLRSMVSTSGSYGGAFVRRPAPYDELIRDPGCAEAIKRFVEHRLFLVDRVADGTSMVTLAHEALLQHWPRMQDWLDDNAEFLITRGRVLEAASRWQKEGRAADLLLHSGKPLAEAADLLQKRRGELPPEAIEFITASVQHDRARRRRRTIALAALAVAITSCIFIARHYSNELEHTRIEQRKIDFERDFNKAEIAYLKVGSSVDPTKEAEQLASAIAQYQSLKKIAEEFVSAGGPAADLWLGRLHGILDRLTLLHYTKGEQEIAKDMRRQQEAVKARLPASAKPGDTLSEATTALIGRAHAAQSAQYSAVVAQLTQDLAIANEHLKALLKQDQLLRQALAERMAQQKTSGGNPPPTGTTSPTPPNTTPPAPEPNPPPAQSGNLPPPPPGIPPPPDGAAKAASAMSSISSLLTQAARNQIKSLEFAAEISGSFQQRSELAAAHITLGELLSAEKDRAESKEAIDKGLALLQTLVDEARQGKSPESALPPALVAQHTGLTRHSALLDKRGDAAGATQALEASLKVLDDVPEPARTSNYWEKRYTNLLTLARRFAGTGDTARAQKLIEEAAGFSLKRDDDFFGSAARDVIWRQNSLARAYLAASDTKRAAECARTGLDFAALHRLDQHPKAWDKISSMHDVLGNIANQEGDVQKSREEFRASRDFAVRLYQETKTFADLERANSATIGLSWAELLCGNPAGARAAIEASQKLLGDRTSLSLVVNLLHVHLYENHPEEAGKLARKHFADAFPDGKKFPDVILKDFADLTKAGVPPPGADRIQAIFTELASAPKPPPP